MIGTKILKSSKGLPAGDLTANLMGRKLAETRTKETEITGTLPLTFTSRAAGALKNYRIFGTAAGAGVETGNLFDYTARDTNNGYVDSHILNANGTEGTSNFSAVSEYIPIESNTNYKLIVGYAYSSSTVGFCLYDNSKAYIEGVVYSEQDDPANVFFNSGSASFMRFTIRKVQAQSAMLVKGSVVPATYIPYGYKIPVSLTDGTSTSNYDLFVGDSKLNEDEYIDYETQKVYKRTANFLNFDELIAAPSGTMPPSSNTLEHMLALQLKPSTTYTMYSDGQGAESGDADANRSVYFCGSRAGNTVFNDHSVSYATDSSGMIYIGINSSRTNAQQYINGTAHLWILEGSDAQGDYVPYYSPIDPPAPFQSISTYKGENTLSSTETLGEVTVKGRISETAMLGRPSL